MTSPFFLVSLLLGASGLYLYVVAWSFRASQLRTFSTLWLLLPLSGAVLAGTILVFAVPASSASPFSLRLLELLVHLCNILLIWSIAGNIAPATRLAGTLLYAWNPLVLIELAVYANAAGVTLFLLLLAFALLLVGDRSSPLNEIALAFRRGGGRVEDGRGRLRSPSALQSIGKKVRLYEIAALVLIGLAMRIDLMTLLLVPLLLWFMVRHERGMGMALMGLAWRALVVLAIFVLAYLPGWRGIATFLSITNGLRLFDFSNSPLSLLVGPVRSLFSFVAQQAHFPPLMQPSTAADMTVLATSFFLFALLYLREMGRVRMQMKKAGEVHPIRPVGTGGGDVRVRSLSWVVLYTGLAIVILGYIVLAAPVFLSGYLVWGVWVIALRRFDTLSVCVLLLSCSALLYYPWQRFALASTGFLLPLYVFGIPLVYLLVHYCMPSARMERKKVLK